jgi:triosephosphate isomerase (TIM)
MSLSQEAPPSGTGSMARPVLAANWKMNLGPVDARAFVGSYIARVPPRRDRTVILFPPSLSLAAAREAAADRRDLRFGVQNVFWEAHGAFTGEVSAPMARDAGAAFVLVGHSERRQIFHESDEETGRKCAAVAAAGLVAILCVGELLAEHERGMTSDVVLRQLRAGLCRLTPDQIGAMAIAYEPVWAIGTGRTATAGDASATHRVLADALRALLPAGSPMIPILYGGSVNATNAGSLLSAPGVDGLLVGGASLDPTRWGEIVTTPVTR